MAQAIAYAVRLNTPVVGFEFCFLNGSDDASTITFDKELAEGIAAEMNGLYPNVGYTLVTFKEVEA